MSPTFFSLVVSHQAVPLTFYNKIRLMTGSGVFIPKWMAETTENRKVRVFFLFPVQYP